MHEHKFRGRRVDNGEWAYGSLLDDFGKKTWIVNTIQDIKDAMSDNVWFEVDPSTVGEFTGLCDKNGVEIYEGDILRDPITGNIRQIFYHPPAFILRDADSNFYWTYHADEYEVIGNVWENPDLLGGERSG